MKRRPIACDVRQRTIFRATEAGTLQPPRTAAPRRLPFFEFMLYGAPSFAPARGGESPVCVARGRSLTLVDPSRSAGPERG